MYYVDILTQGTLSVQAKTVTQFVVIKGLQRQTK